MIIGEFEVVRGAPTMTGESTPTSLSVIGVDDDALLLDEMASTEIASADLPSIDTVHWTADFGSTELRQHSTAAEWQSIAAA